MKKVRKNKKRMTPEQIKKPIRPIRTWMIIFPLLAIFGMWFAIRNTPYNDNEIVKLMNNGENVVGRNIEFEVKDVITNTAIGDVVHTNNRSLVIQSDYGKYWEYGHTYSYEIIDQETIMGMHIITIAVEGDDK